MTIPNVLTENRVYNAYNNSGIVLILNGKNHFTYKRDGCFVFIPNPLEDTRVVSYIQSLQDDDNFNNFNAMLSGISKELQSESPHLTKAQWAIAVHNKLVNFDKLVRYITSQGVMGLDKILYGLLDENDYKNLLAVVNDLLTIDNEKQVKMFLKYLDSRADNRTS